MLPFRRNRDPLVIKALPITAIPTEDSNRLADKFASRVEWMRENGIDVGPVESERSRSASKSPLPGTVLYFSRIS